MQSGYLAFVSQYWRIIGVGEDTGVGAGAAAISGIGRPILCARSDSAFGGLAARARARAEGRSRVATPATV